MRLTLPTGLPRAAFRATALTLSFAACLLATGAPASAAPIVVSADGRQQRVVVDRDGTAHVVWSERRLNLPDQTHYCQIPIGEAECTQRHVLAGTTEFDTPGPQVMLSAFGDVLALTHRGPTNAGNRLYVNGDGGTVGGWSGPQALGSNPPTGEPGAIYDDLGRQVLTVTGLETFGLFFQAQRLGAVPSGRIQVGTGTLPRDGSIAQTAPKAFMLAFASGEGDAYVRRFACDACPAADQAAGINDPARWTAPVVVASGAEQTQVVSGPTGTFLIYRTGEVAQRRYEVRRWLGGDAWSGPTVVSDVGSVGRRDLYQDLDGVLHLAYVDGRARLVYRRSLDGVAWSDPLVIASHEGQVDSFGQPRVAVRSGGINGFAGFVTWTDDPNATYNRTLYAEPLPAQVTFPGGGEGGGGGGGAEAGAGGGGGGGGGPAPGPAPTPRCQTLSFRAVDVIAGACFRRDGSAYVATGTVRMNGLGLVPDDERIELRFDPARATIRSTGPVRIEAGATLLWRGRLDFAVPNGRSVDVADLDVGRFGGDVFGFGLRGTAKLRLIRGAASVPVHVALPSVLGGVTGDVDLRADNVAGLHVHDLRIAARSALLGPVEVRDLLVHYNPDEEIWSGAATLVLPPQPPGPSLSANFGLRRGQFDHAGARLDFSPGLALGPAIFLNRIGFQVATRPTRLTGEVGLSGGPTIGAVRAVQLDGTISFTFPNPPAPAVLRADGRVSVVNVGLANAHVEYRTNGYFEVGGHLGLSAAGFQASADLLGWIDRTLAFNFEADANVCLGNWGCVGGEGVVSSTGVVGCAEFLGAIDAGAGYRWGESFTVMAASCDVGDYRAVSTVARASGGARAAAAGSSFRLGEGLPGAVIEIRGATAPPDVTVSGPGGRSVVVPAGGPLRTPDVAAFHIAEERTTYVILRRPPAGEYRVAVNPGSSEIADVRVANALPEPQVRASVSGRGRARVLRYRVTPQPGMQVRFVERGPDTARVLGRARGRSGAIRFRPMDGRGGRRAVEAIVTRRGAPLPSIGVATYVAPPPPKPPRVRSARLGRAGGGVRVSWTRAAGAARYYVRTRLSDGRSLLTVAPRRARRATIPAVPGAIGGRVTVAAVRADGATGRPATARLIATRGRGRARRGRGRGRRRAARRTRPSKQVERAVAVQG